MELAVSINLQSQIKSIISELNISQAEFAQRFFDESLDEFHSDEEYETELPRFVEKFKKTINRVSGTENHRRNLALYLAFASKIQGKLLIQRVSDKAISPELETEMKSISKHIDENIL